MRCGVGLYPWEGSCWRWGAGFLDQAVGLGQPVDRVIFVEAVDMAGDPEAPALQRHGAFADIAGRTCRHHVLDYVRAGNAATDRCQSQYAAAIALGVEITLAGNEVVSVPALWQLTSAVGTQAFELLPQFGALLLGQLHGFSPCAERSARAARIRWCRTEPEPMLSNGDTSRYSTA